MIRTLNIICIIVAGLSCLGLYRVAEGARIARAELNATERSIKREENSMIVLGAEWARLTQPNRVQALAARHLALSDKPLVELSSLNALPRRDMGPAEGVIREARAVVLLADAPLVEGEVHQANEVASVPDAPLPDIKLIALQTGM